MGYGVRGYLLGGAMRKHLKREPHHIKGKSGVWWYEVNQGMEIHVENTAIDPRFAQSVFVIDWNIIRRALKRKDKKQ